MRSLDGVRKKPAKTIVVRPQIKIQETQNQVAKPFSLLDYIDLKQAATVMLTFAITFVLSIATSQSLANKSKPQDQVQSKVLGASTVLPRGDEPGITVTDTPDQNLAFDNIVITQPDLVFLPSENISLPDPLIDRREFLKQYLEAKNSPLAAHVDAISEQSQWRLIIAIAQAESSSCKNYPQHSANCWGIGGASNLMRFKNLDAAIQHVNDLLEEKYISQGLTSPQKLAKKWVGQQDQAWEAAVEKELENLKNIQ